MSSLKGRSPAKPQSPPKATSPPKGTAPVKGNSPPSKGPAPPTKGAPAKAPAPAPAPAKAPAPAPAKKSAVKAASPAPAVGGSKFDAKAWAKDGVAEEEITQIKAAFDLFDTDQGGSIDIKELKAAMTSLGFQSKSSAIFQMISDLDADGNGTIDFGEWVSLMTKRVNDRDTRANINKIFALFDEERTGYISVKNLQKVAASLGENISEAELHQLVTRADVDQDGLVSEQEFYVIITRPIKQ